MLWNFPFVLEVVLKVFGESKTFIIWINEVVLTAPLPLFLLYHTSVIWSWAYLWKSSVFFISFLWDSSYALIKISVRRLTRSSKKKLVKLKFSFRLLCKIQHGSARSKVQSASAEQPLLCVFIHKTTISALMLVQFKQTACTQPQKLSPSSVALHIARSRRLYWSDFR